MQLISLRITILKMAGFSDLKSLRWRSRVDGLAQWMPLSVSSSGERVVTSVPCEGVHI